MNWEQLLSSQIEASSGSLNGLIAGHYDLPADHVLAGIGERSVTASLMTVLQAAGGHALLPSGPLEAIADELKLPVRLYPRLADLTLDVADLLAQSFQPDLAFTWVATPDLETGLTLSASQLHLLLQEGTGALVVDNRLGLLSEQDYRPFVGHPRLLLLQGLPLAPWSSLELFWVAAAPETLARLAPLMGLPAWLEDAAQKIPWPDLSEMAEGLKQKRQRTYLTLVGRGASPLPSEGPFLLVQGPSPIPANEAPGLPGFQRIDLG